jgi:hypothetical protein
MAVHPDLRLELTVDGRLVDLAAAAERRTATSIAAKKAQTKSPSNRRGR